VVGSATDVAEFERDLLPRWPVCGIETSKSVCHFMQQHLMNFVVVEACGEIARDGDAFVSEVALPGSSLGVIECE